MGAVSGDGADSTPKRTWHSARSVSVQRNQRSDCQDREARHQPSHVDQIEMITPAISFGPPPVFARSLQGNYSSHILDSASPPKWIRSRNWNLARSVSWSCWSDRCRASSAQIRQSRPDSGLGLRQKCLIPFKWFPFCLVADLEALQSGSNRGPGIWRVQCPCGAGRRGRRAVAAHAASRCSASASTRPGRVR